MKYLMMMVLLTGCAVDVHQWEINKAVEYCGSVSSIQYVKSGIVFTTQVYCTNGKSKTIQQEYE